MEDPRVGQRSGDYMPQIYAPVAPVLGGTRTGTRKAQDPRIMCSRKATQQHQLAIENAASLASNNQVKALILLNGPV